MAEYISLKRKVDYGHKRCFVWWSVLPGSDLSCMSLRRTVFSFLFYLSDFLFHFVSSSKFVKFVLYSFLSFDIPTDQVYKGKLKSLHTHKCSQTHLEGIACRLCIFLCQKSFLSEPTWTNSTSISRFFPNQARPK